MSILVFVTRFYVMNKSSLSPRFNHHNVNYGYAIIVGFPPHHIQSWVRNVGHKIFSIENKLTIRFKSGE